MLRTAVPSVIYAAKLPARNAAAWSFPSNFVVTKGCMYTRIPRWATVRMAKMITGITLHAFLKTYILFQYTVAVQRDLSLLVTEIPIVKSQ